MGKLQPQPARAPLDLEQIAARSGLSLAQVPIWIGQSLHPASPLYNMAFAFVLEGTIDEPAFLEAWRRVVAASDVLRTRVMPAADVPARHLYDEPPLTRRADFAHHPDAEAEFRSWAHDRCRRPLPLDGPLVDSVLVRLGATRYGWYLNQHHLVTDAFATILLLQRVSAEYESVRRGSAPLPPLPAYYPMATALATFPDARSRREASEHWTRRRSSPHLMSLYGRSSRPSSTRSRRLTWQLDEDVSRQLHALAGETGFQGLTADVSRFSLFATLLCAWLSRVDGERRVGFDAPAQNRPTRQARSSLGLFIEMLPFEVEVDGADTFRTLARKCLAEAQRFLRASLPGAGAGAGGSAGSIVLNFLPVSFGTFAGVPVTAEWLHPGESDSIHGLRLQVHDYDATGRYTLHFDFNEEVVPEPLQRRAMGHFERLLLALLENPDACIAAVAVLTPEEHDALLGRFNATDASPLPSQTMLARFHDQAHRSPDAVAVREASRAVSYSELQRSVLAAADALVAAGLAPGELVALVASRSIDAVIAMLAVLQARAAYVPIDAGSPPERMHRVLADCGASRVIAAGSAGPNLDGSMQLLRVTDLVRRGNPDVRLANPQLRDRAYVMYTSGSTGTPKGVIVCHDGLAGYLEWAARTYVRDDRLSFPLFTPLGFDLTITSLYLPLITGGTLVIYPEGDGPADTAVAEVVAAGEVDAIKLTPSHLSLLRHMDLSASRIRRIIVGGEDFRTHLAADIAARFDRPVEIYNEYGPTEAVVGCMVHRYDPATDHRASVPIGRPADHVRLYVLNEAMSPVPEGVAGELYIARPGLAEGYHNLPDATARQFLRSSFLAGDRLYRTGDMVRFIDPHRLEYLGRADRQVKLSSIRVELGEIEAALLRHGAVTECLVLMEPSERPERPQPSERSCTRCGLPSTYPATSFDGDGVCSVCRSFESLRARAAGYFKSLHDLRAEIAEAAGGDRGRYDCLMLLSGGKDSTYALCRLVDMGLRVFALSFDNGYISDQAKENVRRVVGSLQVDHEFAAVEGMDAIFRDSLVRFSNVCNGCFKVIYTLGMTRADQMRIPVVVTGLSRGQLFETRLTPDLFREGFSPEDVDAAVLAARKAYHRSHDEVSRRLDVRVFQDDGVFERVRILDFYRYCDADLDDMLAYLATRVPWMRPDDTGRSTNCLANDVGIYIHTRERGYHNYALPYSWDVRMGHKTRQQAVEELHDALDMPRVRRILSEIGYDEDRLADTGDRLIALYVGPREVPAGEWREHLGRMLPSALIPARAVRVDALPLTPNGKIDEAAALAIARAAGQDDGSAFVAPAGPVEEGIAGIWKDVLRVGRVDAHASLFALGGTSLAAMEIALRICREFSVDLPLQTVFATPTVAGLAARVEALIVAEVAALSDEEAERRASTGADDSPGRFAP